MSARVGRAALLRRHRRLDQPHVSPEEPVDPAHPLRVALGQVVVDRDDVDALALEGVEVAGQGGHEGLALAGLHLGDVALVQGRAAHQLDVEVALADRAAGALPDGREGLGQQVVEGLAVRDRAPGTRASCAAQLLVGEVLDLGLERVDESGTGPAGS